MEKFGMLLFGIGVGLGVLNLLFGHMAAEGTLFIFGAPADRAFLFFTVFPIITGIGLYIFKKL